MADGKQVTHCIGSGDEVGLLSEISTDSTEVLINGAMGVSHNKEGDFELIHQSLFHEMAQPAEHELVLNLNDKEIILVLREAILLELLVQS